MIRQRKSLFTWRLKLILACGCILGLAVGAFSYYVAQLDDPVGTIPISWTFKAKSRNVPEFFRIEPQKEATMSARLIAPPSIDQVATKETEFAIFALG